MGTDLLALVISILTSRVKSDCTHSLASFSMPKQQLYHSVHSILAHHVRVPWAESSFRNATWMSYTLVAAFQPPLLIKKCPRPVRCRSVSIQATVRQLAERSPCVNPFSAGQGDGQDEYRTPLPLGYVSATGPDNTRQQVVPTRSLVGINGSLQVQLLHITTCCLVTFCCARVETLAAAAASRVNCALSKILISDILLILSYCQAFVWWTISFCGQRHNVRMNCDALTPKYATSYAHCRLKHPFYGLPYVLS